MLLTLESRPSDDGPPWSSGAPAKKRPMGVKFGGARVGAKRVALFLGDRFPLPESGVEGSRKVRGSR